MINRFEELENSLNERKVSFMDQAAAKTEFFRVESEELRKRRVKMRTSDDFINLAQLGKGGFGSVFQ